MASHGKPYLTPQEAARMLMVSPVTVRQWARAGKLPAETTLGGHRRFLRRDVEIFARRHGLALQPDSGEAVRILVVDDDEQLVGMLRAVLEGYGDRVVVRTAADGFEAGRLVQRFRPDVVLLDIRMPGLDGVTVCRQIKEDPYTRTARVIAMTGYPSGKIAERVVAAGAETCLAKPFEIGVLLEHVGLAAEEGAT